MLNMSKKCVEDHRTERRNFRRRLFEKKGLMISFRISLYNCISCANP